MSKIEWKDVETGEQDQGEIGDWSISNDKIHLFIRWNRRPDQPYIVNFHLEGDEWTTGPRARIVSFKKLEPVVGGFHLTGGLWLEMDGPKKFEFSWEATLEFS